MIANDFYLKKNVVSREVLNVYVRPMEYERILARQ